MLKHTWGMVSEGQKCGMGGNKLFKVQSLEQWGEKKKAFFFFSLFFASFAILEMGKIILNQVGMQPQ